MFKLEVYSSRSLNALPPFAAPGARAGGWSDTLERRAPTQGPDLVCDLPPAVALDAPRAPRGACPASLAGLAAFLAASPRA